MSRHGEEYADDDRDDEGYVHELRCDDGKKQNKNRMDGWMDGGGMVTPEMEKGIKVFGVDTDRWGSSGFPSLVWPFLVVVLQSTQSQNQG